MIDREVTTITRHDEPTKVGRQTTWSILIMDNWANKAKENSSECTYYIS